MTYVSPYPHPAQIKGKNFNRVCILLVEDDIEDNDRVSKIMTELFAKYVPVYRDTVHKAIKYLESLHPEELPCLIISDINMPAATGLQLLDLVKRDERFKHIPFAIYTNSTFEKHVKEAMALGACTYLKKSASAAAICEDVRQMVACSNPA